MVQINKHLIKDIGLQREVEQALPYAVVGGAWEASFERSLYSTEYRTVLNHIVPAGQQLKILFLRVFTQEEGGARFAIYQTNPAATGATGTTEAYPVVGNTPSGYRDYPKLEAAGGEVLQGSLIDPVHVLEGSVDFRVLSQYPGAAAQAAAGAATGAQYSIVWAGVEKVPEPKR